MVFTSLRVLGVSGGILSLLEKACRGCFVADEGDAMEFVIITDTSYLHNRAQSFLLIPLLKTLLAIHRIPNTLYDQPRRKRTNNLKFEN